MSSTHTPEPWYRNGRYVEADDDRDFAICANVPLAPGGYYERSIPNADRIVACVNGCKGVPDPETDVPELIRLMREVREIVGSWGPEDEPRWLTETEALLAKIKH